MRGQEERTFPYPLCYTVPAAQQGLPVLMSHSEALAMPPIHRASFPKARPLPHVERGGLWGPFSLAGGLLGEKAQGVLWGSVMLTRTSLVSTFL